MHVVERVRPKSLTLSFLFIIKILIKKETRVARTNYGYEKRQKELARLKKKEEKRQRKLDKKKTESTENSDQPPDEGEDS